MNRLATALAALAAFAALGLLGACATLLGGSRAIDTPTVAVRTDADAAAVAGAIADARPRVAFLASTGDAAWFQQVAAATDHHLSGPADMAGLRMAFLAGEPVGDTTLVLRYDGGSVTVHDALYEVGRDRMLDLLAFRVRDAAEVRPVITALLEYVATDVSNEAAVVMAVAVPDAAAGDSVGRMLAPAYYDAARCETGAAAPSAMADLRLFYGPAARMYCTGAELRQTMVGPWIWADLVMGRR